MNYKSVPSQTEESVHQRLILLEKEIQDIKSKLHPPNEECTDNNTSNSSDCTECCLACSFCLLTPFMRR
jgi:hypothetical protein